MLRDQSLDNAGFHSGAAIPTYPYTSSSIRYSERPRPSSARDPVYIDSLEGGYLNQMGSSRMRGPNTTNLQSPYDGRPSSMERGSNYPQATKTCYLNSGQRPSRSNVPLSIYPVQTAAYQSNITNYPFSQSALLQQPQRRAHSYEMNLEKQGLCEYANVLAAAGATPNNPSLNMYGNYGSDRIEGVGSSMPAMTPVVGYGNQGMVHNANYSGMGMSGSSGVMTMSNSIDVVTMQRECVRLHQELDITKEKLNACMTSIRTFWSPELKRERAMRKEENAKYAILADHLHQLQLEKQTMLQTLQNSDAELRRERELHSSRFKSGDSEANELEVARRRIEELTRENRVLSKSVEDAEKRCSNLQASLTATEESLRRLVEAVRTGKAAAASSQGAGVGAGQAKNQPTGAGGSAPAGADVTTGDSLANIRIERLESDRLEIERLREQLNEICHRNSEAEKTLIECEMERSQLKEEVELVSQDLDMARHEAESLRQNIRETQTLQALVDTKESKILTLENEIRLLEDEITRLRDEGITTPNTSLSSGIEDVDRTLNTFRSNERLLKSKVDFLTSELSKRESEIYALQSRLEMTEKQQQDQNHHISVLKEQVKARENKVTMLTADIEDFRKRLKEKEGLLEKKTKLLGTNATSKRQLETEVTELKDQIDLKERKISLLQRKIENLEELVTEKESQLAGAKSRLSRLNTEKTGSDGSKANLEDTLKEKDRQIERLKESLQRLENDTNEDVESQKRLQLELRSRLDAALRDLDEKTSQLSELREEMAQLRSVRYKRDTEISQLQSQLGQRDAEISSLKMEKQMLQKQVTTESEMKYSKIVSDLEGQVNHYMESASKLQTEVDRLLSMIRNSDSEKLDKDNQIHELEEQLHDAQNQISSLKRAQQMDRKKNAQFLEEARQRADNIQSDAEVLKNMMSEKEVRIRELEQALRESVRLTAEREAHVASREDSTRQLEQQIRELRSNVEHLQRERNNLSAQLANQQEELRDRESQLKNLESDCFQGYIPELEKLRRANQDANLKIAALIKLVHGHEDHLTEQDRSVLATIPMFLGYATKGGLGAKLQTRTWGATSGSVPNVGLLAPGIGGSAGGAAAGTAYMGTGASTGGATSPHFTGSAFQLIGSNSAAATAVALSAGGLAMQTADSIMLGRLLHEKETMLQQQLQDLTRLRFQNSEMEVKLKALQRELENKNTRLNALESSQAADMVTGLGEWQTPMSRIQVAQAELTTLRQSNAELREKLTQTQSTLQERENELKRLQISQTSAATLEMERLKLELTKVKEERETLERNLRMEVSQLTDDMNRSNNAALNAEAELQGQKDKIRLLEFEQVKATTEAAALQKKYHTVLGQLTERTDKLQLLEKECQQNHTQEIQRLKTENDDLNHRVTYLHRNNQERETKLEQQETELGKLRDELSNVKKQAHCLEAELKSLREEIAYKDERSRQLQVQHADELARMRSVHQEQSSRLSHLQLALDEKDHELKTLNSDLDKHRSELEHTKNRLKETETERNQSSAELVQKTDRCRALELECQGQADELVRVQSNLEDAKAKNNILQKRIEEREQRLRKIEGENHGLLDEIHGLRKSNHELESHIDVLRQRLLDRDERSSSTVPIPVGFSQSGSGMSPAMEKPSAQLTAELDRLRKQNTELETTNSKTKQALQDLQIKLDQLDFERSNLNRSYEEEREKRTRLEKELQGRDAKIQKTVSMESTAKANAQIDQLTLTVSQLKRDVERRDSQIQQLSQQIAQSEKLSRMSTATGSEKDALLNELKISLQRTQKALDEANEQNHLIQARTETTMLETQQQFLVQQQSLQQQIASLQQSLHEAGMNSDRLQKEVRQSSTRIQDLTRQLRETQANCDSIASQRDSLQTKIEQLQQSAGRSGGSMYGGRPASVAGGYSDLLSSSTTSTSQLSRELDRLHREQESMRSQLESAERSARSFKTEAETARAEVTRLKDDLQHQKDILSDLQENLESREEEMSKRLKFETDKLKKQQQDLTTQIANLQKQVTIKDNLIEQLTNQLKNAQEKCSDTERRLAEATKRLDSFDSQEEQATLERNQQQRLSYELETVKKELNLRETQFNQLTQKLNQTIKESTDQAQVIQELSRQLEAAKASTQQAERDVDSARRQAAAWASEQVQQQQLRLQSEQAQRAQEAAETLKAAQEARDRAQQTIAALETELTNQKEALAAQAEILRTSEERCKTSHVQEIERLKKETQELHRALDAASNSMKSAAADESLKQQIDVLKNEVSKRDAALSKLEKDCQEKHVRKLEALQVQLRRYEEEAANLNRVLDEQRNGMEERDRLIRQLKSENQQRTGPSPELEQLKAEHVQCAQQIQQKQQQLETLMKQLEDQAEEILTTKIEALTASVAEKNANIALLQTSGSTNANTQQALSKLQTESDQLQKQLRQLSFARDALTEQRKMR